jgi:hypothetical protein
MVTSINRVNSVYEREFSATFQLIANEDTLIFLDGTTDPYTNNNGSTMLGENQTTVNDRIGSANYDMGHVFSTGGGGVATLNSVCNTGMKARGVTGLPSPIGDAFDIDYVAHEMGHQFGGQHTFNANTGSCSGNGVSNSAFEPGSGTTIMAYAGICLATNNLQAHSNPYFHARSLDQMSTFMNAGGNCAATVVSPNTNSKLPAFADSFNIPLLTPFELTAPVAEDTTADTITYCWEEWDLGSFRSNFSATRITGPIFRSYNPDTSRTRIFPHIDSLLKYPPVISYLGEKLADTSRILKFKLTVRDLHNGWGGFNFPDDTVVLSVINTPAPFKVTQPDTSLSLIWMGNHTDTVRWDVAGTDTSAVQCANVDIYLSVDGGRHYPYLLAAAVPNNGMAVITVPDTVTTTARVKVKGAGNVFFDLSDRNFTITADTTTPPPSSSVAATVLSKNVSIYPVPAKDVLHIQSNMNGTLEVAVYNTVGQAIWKGNMQQQKDLQVNNWAKGVYYVQLIDKNSKEKMVKPVVIQ